MRLTIDNLTYYNPSTLNLILKGNATVTKAKADMTISGNKVSYNLTSAEKSSLGSNVAVYVQLKTADMQTEVIKVSSDDLDGEIVKPFALEAMKVKKSGDTIDGLLVHEGAAISRAGSAVTGYDKIIHIVNNGQWKNAPLIFRVMQRVQVYCDIVIAFSNVDSTNLEIVSFYCKGSRVKDCVAVCSGNTCDIYLERSEASNVYTITDLYGLNYQVKTYTITFPNTYYGSTAPDGTHATKIHVVNSAGNGSFLNLENYDAAEASICVKNANRQINLTANSSNAGLYDRTNSKWIVYSTSAGELHYTQGYVDNNGLVWWRVRNTNTTNPHEIDLGVNATGQAGIYDRTFEKYLIVSDKSGVVTLTTINNKINTSSANEIGFTAKNTTADKQIDLIATAGGYAGLYDRTNSKYLIYSNSSGACVIPQNLYHYGVNYEYYSSLTKGTNPSSNTETGLYISDKNGNTVAKRIAFFKSLVTSAGTSQARMGVYRYVADSTDWADLLVQIPQSGSPTAYFCYSISGTASNYQLAHMGGPNWSNTSLAHGMRVYKWGRVVMLTLENCKMTAAYSANAALLTLADAYKPIYQVGFMSTSSKRFYIGTSGNVYCASALAKDEAPRGTITYISAS